MNLIEELTKINSNFEEARLEKSVPKLEETFLETHELEEKIKSEYMKETDNEDVCPLGKFVFDLAEEDTVDLLKEVDVDKARYEIEEKCPQEQGEFGCRLASYRSSKLISNLVGDIGAIMPLSLYITKEIIKYCTTTKIKENKESTFYTILLRDAAGIVTQSKLNLIPVDAGDLKKLSEDTVKDYFSDMDKLIDFYKDNKSNVYLIDSPTKKIKHENLLGELDYRIIEDNKEIIEKFILKNLLFGNLMREAEMIENSFNLNKSKVINPDENIRRYIH